MHGAIARVDNVLPEQRSHEQGTPNNQQRTTNNEQDPKEFSCNRFGGRHHGFHPRHHMRLLVFPLRRGSLADRLRHLRLVAFLFWATATTHGLGAELTATNVTPAAVEDPTEIPLERLMTMEVPRVYAASKFEQKQTEAPSSVTIVTGNEIQKYGHQTLADVLRSVRGLHVSFNRAYEFLGTRGFNRGDFNSRVLVLVDGHRINNGLSDGAFIGTAFPLDVDLIERVEIIRGPGSVLYGNNAFFGVINVVTKSGSAFSGAGVELSAEGGSYDLFKRRATFGQRFTNGLEVLFSTTLYDREGPSRLFFEEFDMPANNNGVAEDLDDEHFYSFFGQARYRGFALRGSFISRDKGIPTAPFGVLFNDPRTRALDERGYLDLTFEHEIPEVATITAQVYYDRQENTITYPLASAAFQEDQIGEWWGTEVKLQKLLFDRHTLIFGGEYRDDFHQERTVFNTATGVPTAHRDRATENYGIYLQADFMVLSNLHFNAGMRYDQYGELSPSVNPRAAIIYEPWRGSTLKAIYGTAFRAPNFFELIDPRFQDLQPETVRTYELAYEQELGYGLRSSLSLFYSEIEDLISFQGGRFDNLNGAESKGIETGLSGQWRGGWQGQLSYTFQETTETETGSLLTDAPKHLAKANLVVPLWREKIFAGLEFQFTSKRQTARVDTTGLTLEGDDVPEYGIFNFTLFSRNLIGGLDGSISIYNLLDQAYGDPSTSFHRQDIIPQDGRTFRVKLTYRF